MSSEHDDIVIETAVTEARDRSPSPTPSLAETVAETLADANRRAPAKKRARTITSVSRVEFSERLERLNDTYTAALLGGESLCILTPPVVLKDVIVDEEGLSQEYTRIKLKRVYGDTLGDLEDRLLQTAKDRKVTWFQNEDIEDSFLEGAMKRFYDRDTRTLTVRVDDDVGGRLNTPAGSRIRCVLELNSAVFTRTQFGCLWTLTLVKAASHDEDLYLFDPDENAQHESISTHDLMSCLVHKDMKTSPDETVEV